MITKSVCLTATLAIIVQVVAGLEPGSCSGKRCDACIQTPNCRWCPDEGTPSNLQCRHRSSLQDGWCPNNAEVLDPDDFISNITKEGELGLRQTSPEYIVVKTRVGHKFNISFRYEAHTKEFQEIAKTITGARHSVDVRVTTNKCDAIPDRSSVFVCDATAFVKVNSCPGSANGPIRVTLKPFRLVDNITIELSVICACDCGTPAEEGSAKCSGNGVFNCGGCTCKDGWDGDRCDQKLKTECKSERGDTGINFCMSPLNDLICSGNGHCECGKCVCDGFFEDYNEYCADICLRTSQCAICRHRHRRPDSCMEFCGLWKTIVENDLDSIQQNDGNQLLLAGTNCNATDEEDHCVVRYLAASEEHGATLMLEEKRVCPETSALIETGVKAFVPAIVGALLGVAAISFAAMAAWKTLRKPPMLAPQYENIGAEGTAGENPLYRPPTSSFKNPTYGKV